MKIDAHQHYWIYQAEKQDWINDEMAIIRKDFTPHEVKKELEELSFDGAIAVQAEETYAENEFLLGLAEEHPFIQGIVGWVDLLDKQVEDKLVSLKTNSKIVGFRTIMQGAPVEKFLGNNQFKNSLKKLVDFNYTFDLLVHNNQLPDVIQLTEQLPDNKFMLDHLGKPAIKEQQYKEWKSSIKILAQHPNIYCKLSGMTTEADYTNWHYDQLYPYMEIAAEYFGMDRLCFGSDWPVCLVAGSYATTTSVVEQFCTQLSKAEKDKIFGLNTKEFYKL